MMDFLSKNWFYLLLAIILVGASIYGWIRYRQWLWENMFGVAFVHCVAFSIPTIRVKFIDLIDVEFVNEGPHWTVTVAAGVLHFLTMNRRFRFDGSIPNQMIARYDALPIIVGGIACIASSIAGVGPLFSTLILFGSIFFAMVYSLWLDHYFERPPSRERRILGITIWRSGVSTTSQ